MNITKLVIQSFQGVNFLDLEFTKPIVLISGKNATGKSSIRDAIRFALTGESGRVKLKKDYPALVRIGADAKKSSVSVTVGGFTSTRSVATGKTGGDERDTPLVLPYLLGHSQFVRLPRTDQNSILFTVAKVKRDWDAIKSMLVERKIEPGCIDELQTTVRRLGFAEGEKYCKNKGSEARGAWQAITGETFGTSKAQGWTAPVIEAEELPRLLEQKKQLEAQVTEIQNSLIDARKAEDDMRQHSHGTMLSYECPECHAKLTAMNGKLVLDLRESPQLPPLEEMKAVQVRVLDINRELAALQQLLGSINASIDKAQHAEERRKQAEERAAMYFKVYGWWADAAQALSPSGIPLQLTEQAVKPINDRLHQTCTATGWKPIILQTDLSVTFGGIPYDLCSESEQWRIDAAITECLSLMSGAKFFVLDRMDVLHPDERTTLIKWLLSIADQHDSIIVLATLKTRPAGLPDNIQTFWLEAGGQIAQRENAA